MPNYRRSFQPGGTFFFTLVTFQRQSFLCTDRARSLLRLALDERRARWPFDVDGFVLLPDHLHAMWTLPDGDSDYSRRWAWTKREFTTHWLEAAPPPPGPPPAQRRRDVWQPRFWEHTIRDEDDRRHHLDYIYYNPVKHGHARCPHEWTWSSFHRHVTLGNYEGEWNCQCEGRTVIPPRFDGLRWKDME